jgi:hypothetical protein
MSDVIESTAELVEDVKAETPKGPVFSDNIPEEMRAKILASLGEFTATLDPAELQAAQAAPADGIIDAEFTEA